MTKTMQAADTIRINAFQAKPGMIYDGHTIADVRQGVGSGSKWVWISYTDGSHPTGGDRWGSREKMRVTRPAATDADR